MESTASRIHATLQAVLTARETVLAATPHNHPGRPGEHLLIGILHIKLHDRFAMLPNLQAAIHHFEQVLATAAHKSEYRRVARGHLGEMVRRRYVLLQAPSDLHAALRYTQAAVAESLPDQRGPGLYHISCMLKKRYSLVGDASDLAGAIENGEAAVRLIKRGGTRRADLLHDLSDHYYVRYTIRRSREDVDEAVGYAEETLAELEYYDGERLATLASVVSRLSQLFLVRYTRFRDQTDLEAAVAHGKHALELAPVGHPERRTRLDRLACLFSKLHDRREQPSDLDHCIAYAEESLETPGVDSGPDDTVILLSRALKWRYERHKNILDLARAIGHVKTVLRNSDDHIQQGFKLRCLSQLLRWRLARLGDVKDADAAADACQSVIENYPMALSTIPNDHPRRLTLLHALTDELTDRSERPGGQLSDLEKARSRSA